MPITVIEATAVGDLNSWELGAGGNFVVAVNLPDDDATTFIFENDAITERITYTMDDLPAEADQIIEYEVRTRGIRFGGSNAGRYGVFVRDTSGAVNGLLVGDHQPGGSFATFLDIIPNDANVAAWTVAEVNDHQLGLKLTNLGSGISVTSLSGNIEWVPFPGGFASGIACWVAAALGSGLFGTALRSEVPEKILAALRVLTPRNHPTAEELHMFFDAMQVRPRFVFLGR